MADIIFWPRDLLIPKECRPNLVPFTRSGGRSIGGIMPTVRTDLGYWTIDLNGILLNTSAKMRTFEAIKSGLSGVSGRLAVPVYASRRAPYLNGEFEPLGSVPFSDDSAFDDDSEFSQGAISILSVGATPIGATSIRLRLINASGDLPGVFFSFNHALYNTGRILEQDGEVYSVSISPSIRELIPDGSDLEFDRPTCLCNLASDTAMSSGENVEGYDLVSVSFVEDTHFWNQLALGLI